VVLMDRVFGMEEMWGVGTGGDVGLKVV
jgi:hypothetical protein